MQISGTDITVLSTNPTAETFADTLVFPPLTTLQVTLRIFFSAYDGQWFSTPETLLVAVVNRPPQQNISLTYRKNNALSDTVTQANGEYWVEARDSLRFNVYAYDPNDTNISIAYHIRNSSTVWMHDTVYPHSSGDTLRLRFPSYSNTATNPTP
jgi:hypothetical protein